MQGTHRSRAGSMWSGSFEQASAAYVINYAKASRSAWEENKAVLGNVYSRSVDVRFLSFRRQNFNKVLKSLFVCYR